MKKRIAAFLSAMLLIMGLVAMPVYAQELEDEKASQTAVVSAYCQEENVYAFLSLQQGLSPETLSANVSIKGTSQWPEIPLLPMDNEDRTAQYLFVVDTSATMPMDTREIICSLTKGLMEKSRQTISFSIASAGSTFAPVQSGMTTQDQVKEAVEKLNLQDFLGDISGKLADAIAYLSTTEKTPGTLNNVVLVTVNPLKENALASQLASIVQESSQVVFHTVNLGVGDSEEYRLTMGKTGLHQSVKTAEEAQQAGAQLAGWVNSLCRVAAPCNSKNHAVPHNLEISLMTEDQTSVWASPSMEIGPALPVKAELEETAEASTPAQTSAETTAAEETAPTETAAAETTITETTMEETTQQTDATEQTIAETTISDDEKEKKEDPVSLPLWVYLIGGGALVAIVVLATLLILKTRQYQENGTSVGIPLQLLIVAGSCKKPKKVYYLDTELVIGSDPACDIVWKDSSVSPTHCRVFMKNGFLWLEDLNPRSKTAIEGMKIYAPNRLRSEDEITIGNVKFKFLF